MYKKIIIVLMIVAITFTYGCGFGRRLGRPTPNQQQRADQEAPKRDKLAKSDKEALEENINGFGIVEDLRITKINYEQAQTKVEGLSQQEKAQVLEGQGSNRMNNVLHEYNRSLPADINDTVQYVDYDYSFDYFLVTSENGAAIYREPNPDSEELMEVEYLHKLTLLQRVEGVVVEGSNVWYRVACRNSNHVMEGYIHSTSGEPRLYRFDRMQEAVERLRQQLSQGAMHFISNYKNQNGNPPTRGDASVDEHGYRVYHSAPAYERADANSDFRYVPDGMLVRILNETNGFYHVNIPTFNGDFYVPKQFIDPDVRLNKLNHVVVIDRTQQNQAAFELGNNGINLVSYTLSTTGFSGEFSFETTLGSYKAIEKRERFEYLQSGTQNIAGYAPFAIRFTGGAYIHGVPVAYEQQNGERVDPGLIEYLHTIGTFPRSNMCVRNFTSHARFLYNWMDNRNGAVIVIE